MTDENQSLNNQSLNNSLNKQSPDNAKDAKKSLLQGFEEGYLAGNEERKRLKTSKRRVLMGIAGFLALSATAGWVYSGGNLTLPKCIQTSIQSIQEKYVKYTTLSKKSSEQAPIETRTFENTDYSINIQPNINFQPSAEKTNFLLDYKNGNVRSLNNETALKEKESAFVKSESSISQSKQHSESKDSQLKEEVEVPLKQNSDELNQSKNPIPEATLEMKVNEWMKRNTFDELFKEEYSAGKIQKVMRDATTGTLNFRQLVYQEDKKPENRKPVVLFAGSKSGAPFQPSHKSGYFCADVIFKNLCQSQQDITFITCDYTIASDFKYIGFDVQQDINVADFGKELNKELLYGAPALILYLPVFSGDNNNSANSANGTMQQIDYWVRPYAKDFAEIITLMTVAKEQWLKSNLSNDGISQWRAQGTDTLKQIPYTPSQK